MGTPFNQYSGDAQIALTDFAMQFMMALAQGPVNQWGRGLGLYREVSRVSIRSIYPVPISAAGFKEFKGDLKYRALFEKSLELKHKTWQDGVEELAETVEAPDFIGWMEEPARIAQAGMSLPNEIIAGELAANPVSWTGLSFFNAAHPVNPVKSGLGTFDNDVTGAGTGPSTVNLEVAKTYFSSLLGPNGKPLGLELTDILAPAAQDQQWRNILEQDIIVQTIGTSFAGVDNRHKGTVGLNIGKELTGTAWYAIARNKPGMYPWILEDQGIPEQIINDRTSAHYKSTLKVSFAAVMRGNGILALPQCVLRFAGTP